MPGNAETAMAVGRLAKTVIDFPETGKHNHSQTLEVLNGSSAFFSPVAWQPPGFCVPK
jgi:hypothetical protein